MAKTRKSDLDRKWLDANATTEEFNAAFKSYAETQWGMPDFGTIRMIVETRRAQPLSA